MDLTKLNRDELTELQEALTAEFKVRNLKSEFGLADALLDDVKGGDPRDVYRNLSPEDPAFKIKDSINKEHKARVDAVKKEWAKNPQAKADFLTKIRAQNAPKSGASKVNTDAVKEFEISEFDEKATLAHVMAKAGLFPSISQAKKNGWDKPITKGEWTIGKKRIKVRIK